MQFFFRLLINYFLSRKKVKSNKKTYFLFGKGLNFHFLNDKIVNLPNLSKLNDFCRELNFLLK